MKVLKCTMKLNKFSLYLIYILILILITMRPIPEILTSRLLEKYNFSKPQLVNVEQEPEYIRGMANLLNTTLQELERREGNIRNETERQQELLRNVLLQNYNTLQQDRLNQQELARQLNEDMQLQNRLRLRAMGGAPGSAMLEMQNKQDREIARRFADIDNTYTSKLNETENKILGQGTELEKELARRLSEIDALRTQSLREYELAKMRAEQERLERERAEQARIARERAAGGMDIAALLSMLNNTETNQPQPQPQLAGQVLGAENMRRTPRIVGEIEEPVVPQKLENFNGPFMQPGTNILQQKVTQSLQPSFARNIPVNSFEKPLSVQQTSQLLELQRMQNMQKNKNQPYKLIMTPNQNGLFMPLMTSNQNKSFVPLTTQNQNKSFIPL